MQIQWKNGLSARFLIFTSQTCELKSCELACKNNGNKIVCRVQESFRQKFSCMLQFDGDEFDVNSSLLNKFNTTNQVVKSVFLCVPPLQDDHLIEYFMKMGPF